LCGVTRVYGGATRALKDVRDQIAKFGIAEVIDMLASTGSHKFDQHSAMLRVAMSKL
jgi:hypothetical protein